MEAKDAKLLLLFTGDLFSLLDSNEQFYISFGQFCIMA